MEIDGVSYVALRKESVDRNSIASASFRAYTMVALRKESVDRNLKRSKIMKNRRVALRKESVDRNKHPEPTKQTQRLSLSARRAWIEIRQFGR